MYYYRLKCVLYSPEKIDLPDNFFGKLPTQVDTSAIKYLESYKHNTSTRATTIPSSRRRSSQPAQQRHVPPTPIDTNKPHQNNSLEGQIDFRFGLIELSTIDMIPSQNSKKKRQMHETSLSLGYGVLHLYRDSNHVPEQDLPDTKIAEENSLDKPKDDSDDGKVICILAVPSYLAQKDFIQFLGNTNANILHYRFISDYSPNKYTVLLRFKDRASAFACYQKFNGRRFNMTEPEISHAVYIRSNTIETITIASNAYPYLNETLNKDLQSSLVQQQQEEAELPTCPVCLERLDQSISGLQSIQCHHTNRCDCISKWGKSDCPVCLCSYKPVLVSSSVNEHQRQQTPMNCKCFECGFTESLWICMVCGHIGCGRYQEAHAYDHYMETGHLYTLEIETQRIWDYLGDCYVHRLIQNTVDGALVELPPKSPPTDQKIDSVQYYQNNSQSNDATMQKLDLRHDYFRQSAIGSSKITGTAVATATPSVDDMRMHNLTQGDVPDNMAGGKLDAMSVEYSYMLTSQLDSQRMYYEEQIDAILHDIKNLTEQAKSIQDEVEGAKAQRVALIQIGEQLDSEIIELSKEKEKADKRTISFKDKYSAMEKNLNEERLLTKSLMRNNELLKKEAHEKEATFNALTKQVKDLMQILETKEDVENKS
ncbi:hypothetical protein EDC96DRAFT_491898 [Choanephora cucurbitarum]|nr:hypothetical protein EDC96DRAFT_491898 [Choanephora cucurbitarum]